MENIGNLTISKLSIAGYGYTHFGHPTASNSSIRITFRTGKISNSFGENKIFQDKEMYRTMMSSEQWSTLFFNSNNKNGVPCSISRREDIDYKLMQTHLSKDEGKINNNKYSLLINEFTKELRQICPTSFIIAEKSKEILAIPNEKQTQANRNELLNLINSVEEELTNNKDKVLELFNQKLNILNESAEKDLINDIKSNFLGFTSIENKEEALKLLGMVNKDLKLITNQVNETLETQYNHGILVLENVTSEIGYVGDEISINGYKLTLHQANEEIINGNKVITPGETLVSMQMSVSQFSDFVTSFQQGGGQNCSLTFTKKKGYIKQESLALDKLDTKLKAFKDTFNEIPEKINTKKEEILPRLKRKIGIKKIREMEIDLEQFRNYIFSSLPFYFKEILEAKLETNIHRRQDFQFNVEKVIKDLGTKTFNEEVKKGDISSLKKMLNNSSSSQKTFNNNDNHSNTIIPHK